MPITMPENLRTRERYRFVKGKITSISNAGATILPFGSTEAVDVVFDSKVTQFWKGGLAHTSTVTGQVGDQATVGAFLDDNGHIVVETLYVNHEQVRGNIVKVDQDTLVVEQRLATLNPQVNLSFTKDAVDFDDKPVDFAQFKVGQFVIAQGEILNPGELEIYRIDAH